MNCHCFVQKNYSKFSPHEWLHDSNNLIFWKSGLERFFPTRLKISYCEKMENLIIFKHHTSFDRKYKEFGITLMQWYSLSLLHATLQFISGCPVSWVHNIYIYNFWKLYFLKTLRLFFQSDTIKINTKAFYKVFFHQ